MSYKIFLLFTLMVAGCAPGNASEDHHTASKKAPSEEVVSERELPVGSTCTVQFRRDALGTARETPVSHATDNFNGADVRVTGKLVKTDENWVVVEKYGGKEVFWIPRENVLLIEFSKN